MGKPEGKSQSVDLSVVGRLVLKLLLTKGRLFVEWIDLAQDSGKWRTVNEPSKTHWLLHVPPGLTYIIVRCA